MTNKRISETLTVAGDTIVVERDSFFGGEIVNLRRERGMRDPKTGKLTAAEWFLSRIGPISGSGDSGPWSSDGMGWVKRPMTAATRAALIEWLVVTFQQDNPRPS